MNNHDILMVLIGAAFGPITLYAIYKTITWPFQKLLELKVNSALKELND